MTTIDAAEHRVILDVASGDVVEIWLAEQTSDSAADAIRLQRGDGQKEAIALPQIGQGPVRWDCRQIEAPTSDCWTLSWQAGAPIIRAIHYPRPDGVWRPARVLVADGKPTAHDTKPQPIWAQHFHPLFGWMNDPHGIIFDGTHYHLFHQFSPTDHAACNMCWGHAISDDLINWIHLPVAVFPKSSAQGPQSAREGAFSGSAIVDERGKIMLFFTRHRPSADNQNPDDFTEYQVCAELLDGWRAGPDRTIIADLPAPDYSKDFRDPFVFKGPDGVWKMLIGGTKAGARAIALYQSDDLVNWSYVGPLWRDEALGAEPAECPSLIQVGGQWVLLVSLCRTEEVINGVRHLQPAIALLGDFDGRLFSPDTIQVMDLGQAFFAPTPFLAAGKPAILAWAHNWARIDPERRAISCLTSPRMMTVQDDQISFYPLLRDAYPASEFQPINGPVLDQFLHDGGAVFIVAEAVTDIRITLTFGADPPVELRFQPAQATIWGDDQQRSIIDREYSSFFMVIDGNLLELFFDQGTSVFTHRIADLQGSPHLKFTLSDGDHLMVRALGPAPFP